MFNGIVRRTSLNWNQWELVVNGRRVSLHKTELEALRAMWMYEDKLEYGFY